MADVACKSSDPARTLRADEESGSTRRTSGGQPKEGCMRSRILVGVIVLTAAVGTVTLAARGHVGMDRQWAITISPIRCW